MELRFGKDVAPLVHVAIAAHITNAVTMGYKETTCKHVECVHKRAQDTGYWLTVFTV